MPHIFVVIFLVTSVWTADGQHTLNGQEFKTLKACRSAKTSFYIAEQIIRSQMLPTLADEYAADCIVMTNTTPNKIPE